MRNTTFWNTNFRNTKFVYTTFINSDRQERNYQHHICLRHIHQQRLPHEPRYSTQLVALVGHGVSGSRQVLRAGTQRTCSRQSVPDLGAGTQRTCSRRSIPDLGAGTQRTCSRQSIPDFGKESHEKRGSLLQCLVRFRRQKAFTINDRARLRNPETRFIPEQLASCSCQDKNPSKPQFSRFQNL